MIIVQEDNFVLPESASILRYIASTKEVPDHWYPSKACWLVHTNFPSAHESFYILHTYMATQCFAATGDPQQRARVNSALDWYHGNVRLHAAGLTWHRVIGKNMKQPVSEKQAQAHVIGLQTTLQVLSRSALNQCACHR